MFINGTSFCQAIENKTVHLGPGKGKVPDPGKKKKKQYLWEKTLKFNHTFKAHHRILCQFLSQNTKFHINRIEIKTPWPIKQYTARHQLICY